jgi:hypothetical protein
VFALKQVTRGKKASPVKAKSVVVEETSVLKQTPLNKRRGKPASPTKATPVKKVTRGKKASPVKAWGCPLVPLFVGLAGDGVTGLAIALLFTDFLTCTTDSLTSLLTFGVIES